ncbi:hypothetical protein EYZ11_008889 [Aspergillus tanneri]|uniref:GH18 domain-containing protein n=1 Tax=Aspergillus tanneri TaxID=1220188 RepID=A0A4S3JET3_9EURO|nr:uncharacterized protein ATNIH1004_009825 [Aspergillus tanneri]KAA8643063.1 hypothetical protein ATNIH1004_009825 [Aspergillus tanneri]THC91641.1 hypothetical protein EYZ11_008889 [Aspergillus tanneri]
MSFLKNLLALTMGLASLGEVYAGLDLTSTSNVVVYWGQNSFSGNGDLAQQPLSHYCDDSNIDVIVMAFLMRVNGQGGAPEVDLANIGNGCTRFEGTNLLNCPDVGSDITTCQKKGKTILLSIGGATYSEGGFQSESAAREGADLIWKTFGPPQSDMRHTNTTVHLNTTRGPTVRRQQAVHRPFGNAVLDGYDFDFEANVFNMAPFANRLRELSDADHSRQYFLTAAPQCPYPDQADKDILNGPVSVDAVFVQFYNNYCGVDAFAPGKDVQNNFNFADWDNWAKNVSQNKNARVFLGAPANTGAASTGYMPIDQLTPVVEYSKKFSSFGGVMLWDVTQAYGNPGFLHGLRQTLGTAKSAITRSYRYRSGITRPYRYRPGRR